MAVIGYIAYIVAYRRVGKLYNRGEICGRKIGSFLHWVIRLILFAVLWAITYGVIVIGKWAVSHWVLVVIALAVLAIFVIALYVVLSKKRKKNA